METAQWLGENQTCDQSMDMYDWPLNANRQIWLVASPKMILNYNKWLRI